MDTIRNSPSLFLCVLVFRFVMCNHIIAGDTISSGDSITGNQTITSKGENFELGFFKPGTHSQDHYIGIWYKFSVETVVWVANRDAPILDPYSSKFILSDGNLALFSEENKTPIWSTNLSSNALNKNQVVLGDDGNLVLRDGFNPSVVIWQSFDHPTDTLLPGGKIGFNKKTNQSQKIISWRSAEDPATGFYNLEPESNGTNQYFLYRNYSDQIWTTGEWNEELRTFPSIPGMRLSSLFNFSCISNVNESYFTYSVYNVSLISRIVVNLTGQIQQFTWSDTQQKWIKIWYQPSIPVPVSTAGK
ncbi:hypothetical protein MKX03_003798 [Papaver bracteatum]|nr:hypothetical protein MKX03_003798 [Papaver bracteatum]